MSEEPRNSVALLDSFFERFLGYEFMVFVQGFAVTFVVLAVVEMLWDYFRGHRKSVWEPLANFSFQIASEVINRTLFGLILIFLFVWAEPFAFATIPATWWSWIACFILADLTYYWMHRIEHRVRLFWALHSVHHSSEEYDLSTSLRIFWLIDLSIVIFFIPLVFIGFSAPQVLACMLIIFTYMIWVHTEKIGSMGWFDKVFSSPSVHRVHHGSNQQYLDKNYAGILLVWDHLFGTYEPEVEKVKYGLTNPIETSNPLLIGTHEIICLWRDLRKCTNWSDRLNTLIKPPGWSPAAK